MGKIKLDSRLFAVASLVRTGTKVADVGTDHGYLLAYLIENNIIPSGIAADLRQGPLDNARKTARECEIIDKIDFILSDGLDEIPDGAYDEVVLAGMGGILISDILSRNSYIKSESINIIAQPMSHPENVREFFVKHGFEIIDEVTATDGKRFYVAMSARYSGNITEYNDSYYYLGKLKEKTKDKTTLEYLHRQYDRLNKRYNALVASCDKNEEIDKLAEILADFPIEARR